MAFEKRTWLARIGQGLNKFIIGAKDGEGKQTLTNSPDSVTQQGDVISAENLNDLEDRIEWAFEEIPDVDIKLEKVWTNPNPTSAVTPFTRFDIDTVRVAYSPLEYLIEYYNALYDSDKNKGTYYKHVKIYPLGYPYGFTTNSITVGLSSCASSYLNNVLTLWYRIRNVDISVYQGTTVKMVVGRGFQMDIASGSTPTFYERNDLLVPISVYKVGNIYKPS